MRFFSVFVSLALVLAVEATSRLQVRNERLFERQAPNPPCIGLVRACLCTTFIQQLGQTCASCLSVEQDLNPSTLLTDVIDFNAECASSGLSITLPKSSVGSPTTTANTGNVASTAPAELPTATAPNVGGSTGSSGNTGGGNNQGNPLTGQKTSTGGNMASHHGRYLRRGRLTLQYFKAWAKQTPTTLREFHNHLSNGNINFQQHYLEQKRFPRFTNRLAKGRDRSEVGGNGNKNKK
ncbi:hypothetical protein GALMADRAFT_214565 [Galerina marginata CBS 339.88]|uniref:Uncharacterized protein n=1 Tax=Galerina marginata (strain CBS 339.88) TaxID=685588 RepID=A0A067SKI0_GALM3|nr:hypothetical protein GALMADRAFT_214565 [Galerina marginata CBS 339.88]